MRRLVPVAALLTLAACWPFDFETPLGECADGGLRCGVDAGPPICPIPGTLLCEGFEEGRGTWEVNEVGNGTVTLDQTRPYAGRYAAHSTFPAVDGGQGYDQTQAKLVDRTVFATPRPVLWTRTWFWLSAIPTETIVLEAFVEGSGRSLGVGLVNGGQLYATNSFSASDSRENTDFVSAGRWLCLERQVTFSTSGKQLVYLDGALQPNLTLPPADLQTVSPTRLMIGPWMDLPAGHATPAFEVWFDEAAVSETRIGCGP